MTGIGEASCEITTAIRRELDFCKREMYEILEIDDDIVDFHKGRLIDEDLESGYSSIMNARVEFAPALEFTETRKYAVIVSVVAIERSLAKGDLAHAISVLARLGFMRGELRMYEYAPSYAAARGGRGKSDKNKFILDKAVALFKERMPVGGWKSYRKAANEIYAEVSQFNEDNARLLTPTNLANWMVTKFKQIPELEKYIAEAEYEN